jgi:hypothetical protein
VNITLFHALITSIVLFVTISKTLPSTCAVCYLSSIIMIAMMIFFGDLA